MQTTRWAQDLLDFCYPGSCASCQSECAGTEPLCEECLGKLIELEIAPACQHCALPLAGHDAPCPRCLDKGLHPFVRVLRLGVFADPLKHLIHQIKYHNRWTLAEFLADRLLAQERVSSMLAAAERLVCVPLHPLRHISRGYNQAQLVARRLSRKCGIRLVHPVVRLRNTEMQTQLHSKERRLQNLREAFGVVNPRAVTNAHVVVIDDVMTTGATLRSVARTLNGAKPASLSAIVLAVADPRRRDFQSI